MNWLNYHHLQYFWVVAREGSIVRACEQLQLSQPTISCQIKELERAFGKELFERVGRRLVLTEAGRVVYKYASEIFSLGRELVEAMEHQPADRALKLSVGIVDCIPKSVARLLLDPARQVAQPVRLTCREGKAERLLADLAAYELDIVLSDAPIGTAVHLRGFNHLLGECGIGFFAEPKLAARLCRGFPRSLDGAPVLLPTDDASLRRSLNEWFDSQRIHPEVVGEFEDSALMNSFGLSGAGVFPAPLLVEKEIRRQFGARLIGRASTVRARFYAISVEQKLRHPAVIAICEAARRELFQ
jgi:LysR family transcriptional regulator, transcriptional activator of nhaA